MVEATKAYLRDKDNKNLLVGSDWSIIQNKPENLATTDQLGKLSAWKRDGIQYENGGYDFDHVNNGMNCAYRVADFGSFKLVELRLAFACSKDVPAGAGDLKVIDLPKAIQADGDEEIWAATGVANVFIHFRNENVSIYCQQLPTGGGQYTHDSLLTFHTVYFTTL